MVPCAFLLTLCSIIVIIVRLINLLISTTMCSIIKHNVFYYGT
jgi:hypothetical protein